MVNLKRFNKLLTSLKVNGVPTSYGLHVLHFYSQLFNGDHVGLSHTDYIFISDIVPSLVIVEKNALVVKVAYYDEIKYVVFEMDPTSASGPDGFIGRFVGLGYC